MSIKPDSSKPMDIFVTKPALAVVLSLLFILIGTRAALEIPVVLFPQMNNSTLVIETRYVGASAETVQGFITKPIEQAASSVPGVEFIESNTLPGLSTVNVKLELNRESTNALTEMSARLDQIRFQLPQGAQDPSISVQPSDNTLAVFYLSVQLNGLSRPQVTDYLDRHVKPVLLTIEGVQDVGNEGERKPAMRVWLDPIKLAQFDLSTQDIQSALSRNNVLATIGQTENNTQRINLMANTTLQTVEDFEQLVINNDGSTMIFLRDIARVELDSEEGSSVARYYQANSDKYKGDAIYLAILPQAGADTIQIGNQVYKMLDKINPTLPDGMEINIAYDGTLYMRDSIKEIFITLIETILLVGIVVLLLMGSFRTALVPLVTIPISILGAIAVITLLGFTLNLLTILAIVLSVGLVVDDAIVVVENVSRHMRLGKSRIQAALASSRQLLSPIIGMTITLAAVYAPIGFLSGLTGVLFKEFALTLSVAVIISGIVALTLSPIMSAYAIPEGGEEGKLTKRVNQLFEHLHKSYGKLLNGIIEWRHQIIFAGIFFSVLVIPFSLFSQHELAPTEDRNEVIFIIEAPSNASLSYTAPKVKTITQQLFEMPDTTFQWQVAFSSGAYVGLNFLPANQRDYKISDIMPELFKLSGTIPGLQVRPVTESPLPTPGRFDVEIVVQSTDPAIAMEDYAKKLLDAGYQSGKFLFLDTDLKIDLPQVKFILDRERIADLGLDLNAVNQQLSIYLSGDLTNRFDLDGKAYQVIPMIEEEQRNNPDAILDLKLRTPSGELVPFSAFTTIEKTVAPRVLGRFQQKNSFRIFGGMLPGTSKEEGLSTLEKVAAELLPVNYSIDYAGESREIRNGGNTLTSMLSLALVFVYFALVIQFNSFRDPLVVLLGSVPMALSGAMMFTFLGWTSVNIYSQIGFITLVGLVAKNGILIVEFANHLQSEGYNKLAAIKEAAKTRLRPVLMTTAATALGHFPLILVSGAGAESRNSIGIILVAGVILGTIFTLFVLPCLYLMISRDHSRDRIKEAEDDSITSLI